MWAAGGLHAANAPRPNIVFILSDDQGFADVGYRGSEIRTPHLDRLAAEGVKLEQFYVQPVCTPTRAAFLTGQYPMRLGLQLGVIKPGSRHGLPLSARTLPQALAEAGYFTAITGKWHLGNGAPEYLPTRRGFAHQHGLYLGMHDYFTHEREGGLDWHRNDRALRQEGYSTDLIGDEAVQLIERHRGANPFFLYVAFNAPHTPLQAPAAYLAQYARITDKKRRAYAAMVTAMDDNIGKIVAALERRGLRERTLIVFSSDNGGNLPAASNAPLRDQKGSLYEGGVRVPAFAVWPGQLPRGAAVRQPLHIVDWHATLLKLAGAGPPSGAKLDGRDLFPALGGNPAPVHEEILINAAPGTGALRRGDWKLVINGHRLFKAESPGPNFSWAELGRKSGLSAAEATREQVELFNLRDDPGESRNLAGKHPELLRELMERYERYAREAAPLLDGTMGDDTVPAVWGEFPEKLGRQEKD
jgi:arylsulfatase A-like enzyme